MQHFLHYTSLYQQQQLLNEQVLIDLPSEPGKNCVCREKVLEMSWNIKY